MTNKIKHLKQPTICNEIVYEDSEVTLTKIWSWNIKAVYYSEDSDVCNALLCGEYFNNNGQSTFVSLEGKRLTDLVFDYMKDYEDAMWLVGVKGRGYGYLDKNIDLVIQPKYERADDFNNGYATVHNSKEWLYIDKKGNELFLKNKYERLENFSDGLARVSSLRLNQEDLAYHSDYSEDAGIWGYVDKNGKEVIQPQYIYAFDFINDKAIVAKGKWTKDEKWNNDCKKGGYWTEKELWGVIDKNGKEIIPCVYDEIRQFVNDDFSICKDYYQVHVGGWKNGKWAIVDRNGNFVTESIFEDIYYDYCNGLFTYRKSATIEDIPIGIYDLNQNKILFEPQFDDVSFLDDGNILVEVFDKDLKYKIEKIIDKTGKDVFKSEYTDIYTSKVPYTAIKQEENTATYNIIDKNGNILDSNQFKDKVSYWDSAINIETRTYIYSDGNKKGLKNFDGEIIIPANYEYFAACHNNKNFYYFRINQNSDNEGLMKLDGTIIISPKYRNISVLSNNKIICNGINKVDVYEYKTK